MAGLYLHIPFCEHKCIYCDFYSIAPREQDQSEDALVDRFLAGLHAEIDMRGAEPRFRALYDTIFFGGGTPSLLSASNIGRILESLASKFSVSSSAEITLETNPGTIDLRKFREFRSAGVNRISLGIQSFFDDDLAFLTRIHSGEEAKEGFRNAVKAGFQTVSLDLIFALPGQTHERWASNLEQAVALEPNHLSCYALIVEHNTPLARMVAARQVTPQSPEVDATMYHKTIDYLAGHGYEQYEVSNFAKPGFRCRHNLTYWNHGPYLSFGPSAHSFWEGTRWWNIANLNGYADRLAAGTLPVAGEERLTVSQQANEAIFLGLRSTGLDMEVLKTKYHRDVEEDSAEIVAGLVREGFAVRDGALLRLTSRGYAVCDEICVRLADAPVTAA